MVPGLMGCLHFHQNGVPLSFQGASVRSSQDYLISKEYPDRSALSELFSRHHVATFYKHSLFKVFLDSLLVTLQIVIKGSVCPASTGTGLDKSTSFHQALYRCSFWQEQVQRALAGEITIDELFVKREPWAFFLNAFGDYGRNIYIML